MIVRIPVDDPHPRSLKKTKKLVLEFIDVCGGPTEEGRKRRGSRAGERPLLYS